MAKNDDSLYHTNTVEVALFILFNSFLSIILIWIFARLEHFINQQFFPKLPEAEVQTYMLGLGVFLLIQFLLYPIVTKLNKGVNK